MSFRSDRDEPRTRRVSVNTTDIERVCIESACARYDMTVSLAVRQLPRVLDTNAHLARAICIDALTEHEETVVRGPTPALEHWRARWRDREEWQPIASLDRMVEDFLASLRSVDAAHGRLASKIEKLRRFERLGVATWALR